MPRGSQPGERRGGRQHGSRNKRTRDSEAYARALVDDPEVRAQLLKQAQQGVLPPVLMQMFFAYAFGKPAETIDVDDNGSQARTIQISF